MTLNIEEETPPAAVAYSAAMFVAALERSYWLAGTARAAWATGNSERAFSLAWDAWTAMWAAVQARDAVAVRKTTERAGR